MLTSRFLFMCICSVQNYKPIKSCTCSCPEGEQRLKKIRNKNETKPTKALYYLEKDIFKKSLPSKYSKLGAMKKTLYTGESAGCSLPLMKKSKLRSWCQQNHLTVMNFSEILQETDYFWLMAPVLVECTDWHFEMVVSVYKGLKFLSWVSSCGNQL